jgi:hypothetical protein
MKIPALMPYCFVYIFQNVWAASKAVVFIRGEDLMLMRLLMDEQPVKHRKPCSFRIGIKRRDMMDIVQISVMGIVWKSICFIMTSIRCCSLSLS